MIPRVFDIHCRYIHLTRNVFQMGTKSQLAELRKKTGHSISNCKKALEQNNMDLDKAIIWLEDQAQKQGWEKAMKLNTRAANQGLIGLHIEGKTAALIEIGCETDFVARNNYFQDLVKNVAKMCCSQLSDNLHIQNGQVIKQNITSNQLGGLTYNNSKMVDQVALAIAHLGENILLKRGLLVKSIDNISLAGAVHPKAISQVVQTEDTSTGRYAALVALKSEREIDQIASHQICMQIIAMNPQVINRPHDPNEIEEKKIEPEKPIASKAESGAMKLEGEEDQEEEEVEPEKIEISLMHQEFIYNPNLSVKAFVEEKEVEVIDFIRFECGENESLV